MWRVNCRNQQPDESIDAYYVTTLRNLAKTCNFCDCLKDTLLRDRIVLGIQSQQTRKRLLLDRKLTLQKCIDLCCMLLKSILHWNENSTIENVKSVDQRYRKPPKNPINQRKNSQLTERRPVTCQYCGTDHPAMKEKCPAWGKTCISCGVRNHLARVCRKRRQMFTPWQNRNEWGWRDWLYYITSVTFVQTNVYSVNTTNSPFASESKYMQSW